MLRLPLLVLFLVVCVVLITPLLTIRDPMTTHTDEIFEPPGSAYILGTDALGRDIFSRLLYGGQRTLLNTTLATLMALIPGVFLGLLTGLNLLWLDRILMLTANTLLAIPNLVVALVVLTLLGSGPFSLALGVGLSQIAPCIVVIRAAVISIRTESYVGAAYSFGATSAWVVRNHLLPNIRPVLYAYSGVIFSYSLLNSAALGFLGLGGEPGVPEWGSMLLDGRSAFRSAPWVAAAPGLAITIVVWSVNSLSSNYRKNRIS